MSIVDDVARDRDELLARVAKETCSELVEESRTDAGNARRLVALHGDRFRYCGPHGRFYVFDDQRWTPDDTGQVERYAKDTAIQILQAAGAVEDSAERQLLAKWAISTESESRLRAMMNLSRSEPEIPVLPDELDRDPYLLNVQNGTLDLRTWELREHDPADLITKMAGTHFDPNARAPRFEAFLREVLDGDPELIRFVQRLVGYSLTGSTKEQMLAFLYGLGQNGKSTLLDVILEVMGDYGIQAEPELLLASYGNTHPTGLADLHGARLAVTTEVAQGRRLDEVTVKQLTGGDRLKARFMRQDFFEFKPEFKILVAANHKPIIKGTDIAIWRRIRMVPFNVTIAPEKRDPDLGAKLRQELPGILAWAVRGCVDWTRNGLGAPAAVVEATAEYRTEMDVMGEFLEDCTATGPGAEVGATDLYKTYREWCENRGEKPVTQTVFGREMTDRGFDRGKDTDTRVTTYLGVQLRKGSKGLDPHSGMNTKKDSHVA